MAEESKQTMPSFHQRFNIEVGIEEARQRFINRVYNMIPGLVNLAKEIDEQLLWRLANKVGVEFRGQNSLLEFLSDDFYDCLEILDSTYQLIPADNLKEALTLSIEGIISESETDLGVEWRDGAFQPSGAKLLDEALVNENLNWLADKGYQDVIVPFEKGLRHFLEAQQKPERLWDTVTDIYEAIEALAKRVTGKDKDLSANAEVFIGKLKLSNHYKKMLKDYIKYANDYSRHAAKLSEEKEPLLRNEVEAFIYTSGLFIRLAVQQLA